MADAFPGEHSALAAKADFVKQNDQLWANIGSNGHVEAWAEAAFNPTDEECEVWMRARWDVRQRRYSLARRLPHD